MSETVKRWDIPQEISDVDVAFPAHVVGTLLPMPDDIPEEFKDHHNRWNRFVSHLFFRGGAMPAAKEGIVLQCAVRHLRAVLGSFEPKHEHKIAGAAWLASMWFVDALPQPEQTHETDE